MTDIRLSGKGGVVHRGIIITSVGETLFGIASFQVGTGKDHINLNTASKKNFAVRVAQCLWEVMSGIYSALWHVFQPSYVPLSGSLCPGTLGFKC